MTKKWDTRNPLMPSLRAGRADPVPDARAVGQGLLDRPPALVDQPEAHIDTDRVSLTSAPC